MEPGIFLDLVERGQVAKVVAGFEKAVAYSFECDVVRQPIVAVGRVSRVTRDDVKHRTHLCLKIFKALRGDLKWGVDRIIDQLPRFLRCELDGTQWQPEATRTSWTPTLPGDT